MKTTISQPSFWLNVKKEYVIDNFDSLFNYLRHYTYVESAEAPDGDFNRTFDCLEEVVDDYLEQCAGDGFCHNVGTREDNIDFMVKVISTYIITAHTKKNRDVGDVLTGLIDILVLSGQTSGKEVVEDLKELVVGCLSGRRVNKLGITWDMVAKLGENSLDSLNLFCYHLSQTSLEDKKNEISVYEQCGTLVSDDRGLHIVPMNYSNYTKKAKTLAPLFAALAGVDILVSGKERVMTYEQLVQSCNMLLTEQSQVKPSPTLVKKTYEDKATVTVRVVDINYNLYVETIDPNYETIRGNVALNPVYWEMSKEQLLSYLKVGDYIKVTRQFDSIYPFALGQTFDSFHDEYADGAAGGEYWAVCEEKYVAGYRWLTEEGLHVNVMDSSTDPDEAMAEGYLVRIKVRNSKRDRYGNLVLNGVYVDEDECPDDSYEEQGDEFRWVAKKNLFDAFLEYSAPEETYAPRQEVCMVDAGYVAALSHVVYHLALHERDTLDKCKMLLVARCLATMAGHTDDAAYVKHDMDYINCCVRFASGDAPSDLKLEHDDCLEQVPAVHEKERRIEALKPYDNHNNGKVEYFLSDANILYDNVKGLVDASNMLKDKISPFEINRIKKTIATYLGVADMYSSICSDLTYYGEESDTLEFKSSVVYPPGSGMRPDPLRQKWNILKAICGFLNTSVGGELIIGVNDNGNSCGLNNDIDRLYEAKLITEKSVDKLRNYIKNIVDRAFVDDIGVASYTEITATRIKYIIEKNTEGDYIIRLQITPYEYGLVQFCDKMDRPEGIAVSYYRTSGATIPMTSVLKQQAREKKYASTLDENSVKILEIQKAMHERNVVVLKNYSSQSGIKDRRVEIYQLLPKRNAVIGYDIEKRTIREFKTTRFTSIQVTNEKWKNAGKHKRLSIDVFDMLESPNIAPIDVILKLKRIAYNLLIEEYHNAKEDITKNNDSDANDYPYVLQTKVNDIKGVARFYIGLAKEIKIVKGKELADYAREYIRSIQIID